MIEHLNMKLTVKLIVSFLALTIMSIVAQITSSYLLFEDALTEKTFEKIAVNADNKKRQTEDYFRERAQNLQIVATSKELSDAVYTFMAYGDSLAIKPYDAFNVRTDEYVRLYNKTIGHFSKIVTTYGFEDFYIVNTEGQIVFSVKKKRDLGVNLATGKYKTTSLAHVWKESGKYSKLVINDYEIYEPYDNKMAMFIGVPIIINDEKMGVVIAQISEKAIDKIVNEQTEENVETFLVGLNIERQPELRSNRVSNKELIGDIQTDKIVDAALKKNETGSGELESIKGETLLVSYAPLVIKGLNWAIFSTVNKDEALTPVNHLRNTNLIVALLMVLFILFVGYNLANKITKPIIQIKNSLLMLSKGILPKEHFAIESHSEIGEIQGAFNQLADGMKSYVEFANQIGNNQLNAKFEQLSENDTLGISLLEMQRNLISAEKSVAQRQKEEEKQKWMTEGVARFGDILRQNFSNIADHANNIIQNLVNFVDASQGGIFLYDGSDPSDEILELIACFAYGRRKFLQKKIAVSEGLIGACYLEKETILLTNIPDDYPNIESGLGGTKPKSVLLVPLKIDEKVLGVMEVVSLHSLENHEIQFIERIAENIAASISSSQINATTARLLSEAKMRSEQMVAQEEEMRQNMEELQATQEESQRRETETNSIIEAMNASVMVAQLTLDGSVIQMNQNFMTYLDLDTYDVRGLQYASFNPNVVEFGFWDRLREGEKVLRYSKLKTSVAEGFVKEVFAPVFDSFYEPIRLVVIAYPISQSEYENNKEKNEI